ncbi:MAG: transglutaminase domain protein, partial [Frankiales bacterium]|nr:transglutaminase domain protein [Frankiales bacterium]
MSTRERLTLAAAFAVVLGATGIMPLYADLRWLPSALGAVAVVALAGLLGRRAGLPSLLQPLLGLAVLGEYLCVVFARSTLGAGLLPTGHTQAALRHLVDAGLTDIQRLAPPVPSHAGLTLFAVAGIGAVAVVVDLVAVVLGRAAVAGLPLLVLFAIPSAVLTGGLGWLPFVCSATGWLVLLLVEGGERVGRWGTPLKPAQDGHSPTYQDASLGRVGRRIGAAAVGLAVVVPALIPGLDSQLLGGSGGGSGGGGTHVTHTYDPITRLRDDLRLPTPRDLLTYTTTDEWPDYLRMTTLDQFTDAGWSASQLRGSTRQDGVKGGLPKPAGLTSAPTSRIEDRILVSSLDAQWLPVPFPPATVDVEGTWLYDQRSETVFALRSGTKQLTRSYTVTADRVLPDRALLDAGSTTLPADLRRYAAKPQVTTYVADLTAAVVAGQTTPYGKVAAIQAFFRDPARAFEYDTTSRVPGINSQSALEDFLKGRRGFCEQYASAMAAMIRLAGVPARVAIGFTAGTRRPDGSYVVTTSDAHAWPEAWFAGSGWVRFEPTPRTDGQTTLPGYAVAAPTTPQNGAGGPDVTPSQAPGSSGGKGGALDKLEQLDRANPVPAPAPDTRAGRSGLPTGWLLALVALLLAAALPSLLHMARRRHRWASAP